MPSFRNLVSLTVCLVHTPTNRMEVLNESTATLLKPALLFLHMRLFRFAIGVMLSLLPVSLSIVCLHVLSICKLHLNACWEKFLIIPFLRCLAAHVGPIFTPITSINLSFVPKSVCSWVIVHFTKGTSVSMSPPIESISVVMLSLMRTFFRFLQCHLLTPYHYHLLFPLSLINLKILRMLLFCFLIMVQVLAAALASRCSQTHLRHRPHRVLLHRHMCLLILPLTSIACRHPLGTRLLHLVHYTAGPPLLLVHCTRYG